jgi:hypothetical protein
MTLHTDTNPHPLPLLPLPQTTPVHRLMQCTHERCCSRPLQPLHLNAQNPGSAAQHVPAALWLHAPFVLLPLTQPGRQELRPSTPKPLHIPCSTSRRCCCCCCYFTGGGRRGRPVGCCRSLRPACHSRRRPARRARGPCRGGGSGAHPPGHQRSQCPQHAVHKDRNDTRRGQVTNRRMQRCCKGLRALSAVM